MVQYTKLAIFTVVAATASSTSAQVEAVPGNVGQKYKYRGNTRLPVTSTFPDSHGNSWGVCTTFCHDQGLNESDMKGNIHTLVGEYECQCFNANDDVVLVKTDDLSWKTFKGNVAMTDTVVPSSRKANRKVLESPEDVSDDAGDADDESDEVGSTAQGYGLRWTGTAVASRTFKANDPWTTCNPYCSGAEGLNQYNMAGTAVITGDQIQCSCYDTTRKGTRLVDASKNYYAFSGSHV